MLLTAGALGRRSCYYPSIYLNSSGEEVGRVYTGKHRQMYLARHRYEALGRMVATQRWDGGKSDTQHLEQVVRLAGLIEPEVAPKASVSIQTPGKSKPTTEVPVSKADIAIIWISFFSSHGHLLSSPLLQCIYASKPNAACAEYHHGFERCI